MSKETTLNTALLLYATECAQEGDFTALRAMGFSSDADIQMLKDLHVSDLSTLANQGHVVSVQINLPAFRLLTKQMHHRREVDAELDELIRREAPFELIHNLGGMSKKDYINRRRLAHLPITQGRPRHLSTQEQETLWRLWPRSDSVDDAPAATWLQVAKETGFELRSIWTTLRGWEREGHHDRRSTQAENLVIPGRVPTNKRRRPQLVAVGGTQHD